MKNAVFRPVAGFSFASSGCSSAVLLGQLADGPWPRCPPNVFSGCSSAALLDQLADGPWPQACHGTGPKIAPVTQGPRAHHRGPPIGARCPSPKDPSVKHGASYHRGTQGAPAHRRGAATEGAPSPLPTCPGLVTEAARPVTEGPPARHRKACPCPIQSTDRSHASADASLWGCPNSAYCPLIDHTHLLTFILGIAHGRITCLPTRISGTCDRLL